MRRWALSFRCWLNLGRLSESTSRQDGDPIAFLVSNHPGTSWLLLESNMKAPCTTSCEAWDWQQTEFFSPDSQKNWFGLMSLRFLLSADKAGQVARSTSGYSTYFMSRNISFVWRHFSLCSFLPVLQNKGTLIIDLVANVWLLEGRGDYFHAK